MKRKRTVLPLLEVFKGDSKVGAFYIQSARTVVGSREGAHVRLHSSRIQPEHLVFEVVDKRFIEAVNLADDSRVSHLGAPFDRVRLVEGSVIRLGKLEFRLRYVPKLESQSGDSESADGEARPVVSATQAAPSASTSAWVQAAMRDREARDSDESSLQATAKLTPAPARPPPAQPTPARPTPAPAAAATPVSARPAVASRRAPPPVAEPSTLKTQDCIPIVYKRQKRRNLFFLFLAFVAIGGAMVAWMMHRHRVKEAEALEYLMRHRDGGAATEDELDGEAWGGLAEAGRARLGADERSSSGSSSSRRSGSRSSVASADGTLDFSVSSPTGSGLDDVPEDPEDRLLRELEDMSADIIDQEIAEATSKKPWVDMDAVNSVLRNRVTPRARMCYQDILEKEPDLAGTLQMSITIGTDGRVSSARASSSSSLSNSDLESCVSRHVRAASYPAARNGAVTFTYPFRFSN